MDAQPSLLAGSSLAGRYLVRSLLGRGGMGEVYEADDLRLHRRVAVKVLRADLADDPRVLARFRREALTAGSLNHPSIVAVHDVGADGGRAYLVMELVHGRTLAEVIRAEAPLVPGRAARIAGRVAEALEYAHGRGVVHRDVSPGNVMLTDTGEVKVLDFGIAQVDLGSTGPASARGTAAYVAPEVVGGSPADRRSDVYALGAVLVELLTGSVPAPGEIPSAVPVVVDAVVRRCLAAEPDERFERAGDLADALAGAFDEAAMTRPLPAIPVRSDAPRATAGPTTPVLASAPTLPLASRAGSRRRRLPRWVVAAATTAVGLAGWFVVLPVWQAMSEPPVPPAPPATVLQAPVGLSSTGVCDGFWSARVDLAWTPASTPATGFRIYRGDGGGGSFRLLAEVSGTSRSWTDGGLGLGDSYRYLVRAFDGNRRSPLSEVLPASTPSLCLG
jgi:serine/threonine-protein kinase